MLDYCAFSSSYKSQIEILKAHQFYQELEKAKWVEELGLVFPNSIGRPLDRKRDADDWNKLLSKAKVGKYTIYQMRKTAFTNFASLSPSIPSMLAFTGHSNTSTVMNHYAFSMSEEMGQLLARMDEKRPKQDFDYGVNELASTVKPQPLQAPGGGLEPRSLIDPTSISVDKK